MRLGVVWFVIWTLPSTEAWYDFQRYLGFLAIIHVITAAYKGLSHLSELRCPDGKAIAYAINNFITNANFAIFREIVSYIYVACFIQSYFGQLVLRTSGTYIQSSPNHHDPNYLLFSLFVALALSLVTLDRSFRYASSCLWNHLPASLRQPHSSPSTSDSPVPPFVTPSYSDDPPPSEDRTTTVCNMRRKFGEVLTFVFWGYSGTFRIPVTILRHASGQPDSYAQTSPLRSVVDLFGKICRLHKFTTIPQQWCNGYPGTPWRSWSYHRIQPIPRNKVANPCTTWQRRCCRNATPS